MLKTLNRKTLFSIFSFSFVLRMIFFAFIYDHPERAFDHDSRLYLRLAGSLLDSFSFPSIFRTPVYPSFIAFIYSLFGKYPQALLIFQYLLDSLTAIFVVLIFSRMFQNSRYSYLAGFIYAVNPFAIFYSNMILTETLFTLVLAVSVYYFIIFLQTQERKFIFLSSLLLGAATLCRPISIYLPLFLLPFIFVAGHKFRYKLKAGAAFLIISYMVLIPWYMRNYNEYGRWTLSTVSDLNYFVSYAPEVMMIKNDPSSIGKFNINEGIEHFQRIMWNRAKKKYGWNDSSPFSVVEDPGRMAILGKEGKKVILNDPFIFIASHIICVGRVLFPFYPPFHEIIGNDSKTIALLSLVLDFSVMGFFALGIISFLRGERPKLLKVVIFSMITVIIYFSFIPGIIGYSRFRVPVLPYISIFSAAGLQNFRIFFFPSKKMLNR
jgi:hypothetical protein